eukprot:365693-Chlamydomonas_euryale.AAC.19
MRRNRLELSAESAVLMTRKEGEGRAAACGWALPQDFRRGVEGPQSGEGDFQIWRAPIPGGRHPIGRPRRDAGPQGLTQLRRMRARSTPPPLSTSPRMRPIFTRDRSASRFGPVMEPRGAPCVAMAPPQN